MKVEEAGGLVELAENSGRVEAEAGTQAVMDSLAVAEEPQDMSRLARLSAAKGGKTRAIIKLFGRAAIVLTASTFNLAMWLVWAAFRAARLLLFVQGRGRAHDTTRFRPAQDVAPARAQSRARRASSGGATMCPAMPRFHA